jgi:flap endonuclease-1
MDTLTFNTPILFRHLTYSEARKEPVLEVQLARVLEGLKMDMGQVLRFPLHPHQLSYHILTVC